jgi:hypothetical protein
MLQQVGVYMSISIFMVHIFIVTRDKSVYIATGNGLEDRGMIPDKSKVFLFSTRSRPALGTTKPRILWVLGNPSPAAYSPPSSTKMNNGGAIPPLHDNTFMEWCLII